MNSFQVWGPTVLPCLLVLVGILLNQFGLSQVNARIGRLEDKLDSKIDGLTALINSEVRGLLNMIGDHAVRIVRLEERAKKLE